MQKLNIAVLGATGAVGQRFIQLLEHHPWFQVTELIGSSRSAGKTYAESANWVLDGQPEARIAAMHVKGMDDPVDAPIIFSALPKDIAEKVEIPFAAAGHIVCTNASANRMVEDVPLLLAEVNHAHIRLVDIQRKNRGWSQGALVANSNCTTMPVVMALKPLIPFGVSKIQMVSMQATSGAGYPGVASLDILDNVIPYVQSDEEKMQTETLRMLGTLVGEQVAWLEAKASASCNRVPVVDGHLVNIAITLDANPSLDDVRAAWENFETPIEVRHLPSAPAKMVDYLPQIDRPQIRRDRNAGNGMTTSIGRLREDELLGYKFVALSHNTIRGAAGSSILNAELLASMGYIPGFTPVLELEKVV